MAVYEIKLIRREEVADGTTAFYFGKPAGFEFKAGQFVEMILINPAEPGSENATASAEGGSNAAGSRISTAWETDAEDNSRAFSIASAPDEPELLVATRMRDTAFKRVLKTLPAGAEVQIEGPFGDFTLHNNAARTAVFLMGGIGITPARSIVVEAAERKSRRPDGVETSASDISVGASGLPKIFLFYSNRQQKDAAFLDELEKLKTKNTNYVFIPTMTGLGEPGSENATASAEGGSNAAGSRISTAWERGYINEQILKKYLEDLQGPIYYSAGPPTMVAAMRKMLNDARVNDDDIRTEEFSGY